MPDFTLRGVGPWRGKTARATSDRGERRLLKLQGGYISSDGHEVRQWPGFHTILDLTTENNVDGYERLAYDCVRPVLSTSPGAPYRDPNLFTDMTVASPNGTTAQTLRCWAAAKHIHCFEQVRDRVIIVGESDHRRIPIYTSARVQLTVTSVQTASGGQWQLVLSGSVANYSATDSIGAGMHGLAIGDVVWVEDVTLVSGTVTQALLNAELNDRWHLVTGISVATVTLKTTPTTSVSLSTVTGNIYHTRCNRSDSYPSPPVLTPNYGNEYDKIDDPLALTAWQVTRPLDLDNPCLPCHPAWVANRQRDFSDASPSGQPIEGCRIPATTTLFRGVSRREQAVLPYRVNPDVAGNRLILAAPAYPCVFQVPLIVPQTGEGFPQSPSETTGVPWFSNDLHDKPRALGIPKGMMCEAMHGSPQKGLSAPSPTGDYNFILYVTSGTGFPVGSYKIAISYRDDFTGEEGLASDAVAFTIPTAGATNYGITIPYMHPGYFMPECLATSMNVYMQPPGAATMGLYLTIPLMDSTLGAVPHAVSAKYGNTAGASPDSSTMTLLRFFNVPLPVNSSPLAAIDFTRPAPQARQMPRGAECYRVVRGIGFGVGHSGTHGNAVELRRSIFSSLYHFVNPLNWDTPDELQVRGFRSAGLIQTSTPASSLVDTFRDGGFGGGGKYLPPAYEGVEVWAQTLYPEPRRLMIYDLNRNFRTNNNSGTFLYDTAYAQRLKMAERISDPNIGVAGSPTLREHFGEPGYLVLPRGQIQVSEPGRPEITLAPAIQFLDATKNDDGVAQHHYANGLLVCSKRETYHLTWFRAPTGQVPELVSREHGCIATNSMVEFDGGLAWISERGPVAMIGGELQFIGAEVEQDFRGSNRRYRADSKGMMRHCFGAHDPSRGLVIWGLVSTEATHTVSFNGTSYTWATATDGVRSRFPCDELLVWSYRANAFSTVRPPAGLEHLWMRELRDKNGDTRMCFKGADLRTYALDESWQDTNRTVFSSHPSSTGQNSTTLAVSSTWAIDGSGGATARGTGENLLRVGMPVVIYNADRGVVGRTTISALTYATQRITLAAAQSWYPTYTVEIGHRPSLLIYTTWVGDNPDTQDASGVTLRYALAGAGSARALVLALKTALEDGGTDSEYMDLGDAQSARTGRRIQTSEPHVVGPEVQVQVELFGSAHVSVTDLVLSSE